MATSPSISGPLDALQSIINDVLVQTGKALRASRRDSQGNLTYAYGPTQAKLPETIEHFHMTLNDLESEILSAKSALLRDYNELQEKKRQILLRPTFQVDGQTKRPPTVEMATPPEPVFKDEPMAEDTEVKPMAPFPNMSIDLAEPEPMEVSAKEINGQQPQQKQQPPPPGGMNGLNGTASPGLVPQPPIVDQKPMVEMHPGPSGAPNPPAMPEPSGMNFTDMEFTLAAPPGSEAPGQQPNASKEPSFDMTTFAPADGGGDDLLNLNHLLPNDPNNPPGAAPQPQMKMEEVKADGGAATTVNTDFFGPGSGAADGMDFDFSLGGSGDDTFDDLMNNRDSTFELMDAGGDFDTAFFGLDKADENPA
ncbi:hypothetical protein BBK36DRAFT_1145037 [Trichoderma citrinoviride]|uniref:Uncharacterized protein n=1 Tax=Trichoderma citrinoviride TaxID=58853 RepID=A0A2T4AYU9_9HYPO|nr:hypothetical protein BBK36DRAFT_1145037 [Trichoderma citrinoviride]PTB62245.1 hypothetical protein BBK36DRAFT_1145037 [Trichoderma citrinoviride]